MRFTDAQLLRESRRRLVEYCNGRGCHVEFARVSSEYDVETRSIWINSRYTLANQVYVLLHEIGHMLIIDQRGRREKSFPRGWNVGGLKAARTQLARTDIVLEEVEAWERGLRLADRLGIWYSRAGFDRCRSDRLRSYFAYALRDLWGTWTQALPKSEGG